MYGPNIFAVLTAGDKKNKASSAFKLPENSMWYCKAVGGVAEAPTIDSQEATPADAQSEGEEVCAVDRLVVSFGGHEPAFISYPPGHRGTKGISAKQYSITVDDELWIWLHDYDSTHGTAVGYNGQNQKEVRRKETWILAYEPGIRNRFGDITIHSGSLTIKIEIPNHVAADPQYIENLRAFVKKCKEAAEKSKEEVPVVERLGLGSEPATQAPTEAQTPSEKLAYYDDESIGKGASGEVHRVIRARDGKFFAAKIFKLPAKKKRKRNEVDPPWLTRIRTVFTLMKDNPHANVMQVFEFRETPEPVIFMDYYPDGSIADANIADEDVFVSTFGQILDGLGRLHINGVVHRELKPENFLIRREKMACD